MRPTRKIKIDLPVNRVSVYIRHLDIKEGEGRNCANCPIANAIKRCLPAAGLANLYAYVVPYGGMGIDYDEMGIQLRTLYDHDTVARLPLDKMPGELAEWAMNFDDWDDMRLYGNWKAFEKESGQMAPPRPQPFTFTLHLGDFTWFTQETR